MSFLLRLRFGPAGVTRFAVLLSVLRFRRVGRLGLRFFLRPLGRTRLGALLGAVLRLITGRLLFALRPLFRRLLFFAYAARAGERKREAVR